MTDGRFGPRARSAAIRQLGPALRGAPPDLPLAGWDALHRVAVEHRLAPALFVNAVRVKRSSVPPSIGTALQAAYHSNLGRMMRMRAQLTEALLALNHAGVVPLPLKGARFLLDGTFGDLGERFMADLDLLCPGVDGPRAVEVLRGLGYRAEPRPTFSEPHELPLYHPDWTAPIELHHDVGTPAITAVLPTKQYATSAVESSNGDVTYLAAAPTETVAHHILHTQVQDRSYHSFGLPLRSLHTFGRLVDVYGSEIDWVRVRGTIGGSGLGSQLDSYLRLAARHMGVVTPVAAVGKLPVAVRAHGIVVDGFAALGWPSDLILNAEATFDPRYLRARYGARRSVTLLRIIHAASLWREHGQSVVAGALTSRR